MVAGNCAGLVDAKDIQRCRLVHRGQARRQHALAGQRPRADGCCQRERRRQRHRNRTEDSNKCQWNDFVEWHPDIKSIANQPCCNHAVDDRKIEHDPEDSLLLGACHMGRTYELCCSSKLGLRAGGRYFRESFPALDQGSGIGVGADRCFDRHRLPGQHGMVEQDIPLQQMDVRRDNAPERKLDEVARYQLGGGNDPPVSVASNRRVQSEPRLQRRDCSLGPTFLEKSKQRVENQQGEDDGSFEIFAQE